MSHIFAPQLKNSERPPFITHWHRLGKVKPQPPQPADRSAIPIVHAVPQDRVLPQHMIAPPHAFPEEHPPILFHRVRAQKPRISDPAKNVGLPHTVDDFRDALHECRDGIVRALDRIPEGLGRRFPGAGPALVAVRFSHPRGDRRDMPLMRARKLNARCYLDPTRQRQRPELQQARSSGEGQPAE